MSNYTYDDVLSRIQLLAPDDQLRLLEDLAAIVRQRIIGEPLHSILELEGLGQEIWEGIDAQEYVNQERDAWSG